MELVFLQILLCILVADFITGVAHWFEDTYGLPTWPFIGSRVIEPNIQHHEHPSRMATMGTILTRNEDQFFLALVILTPFWFTTEVPWQVTTTILLSCTGNEVHAWAHMPRRPAFIRFLHELCIPITPANHARHHVPPFDRSFCVLTNWCNPILDRLHFWFLIERLIQITTGIAPKRMSPARRGL